ncbi:hypothetical protein NC652_023482 [Populus alba x Populus x berolinensis]|nr:hypothetical protein NC652_023482 [Populus alba x Populus x berolinensis]
MFYSITLLGYVLGNPVTDDEIDTDSIVPFVHLKRLISDELYECIGKVWTAQILEPSCKLLRDDDTDTLLSSHPNPGSWCGVN